MSLLSPERHKQLSKFMSLVLRHEPEKIGIVLGSEGFVPLDVFVVAMNAKGAYRWVTEEHIREIVETSDKQRFEIVSGQIRARYGHSVEEAITYPEIEPPLVLYHGTTPQAATLILQSGLQSMQRQYVHLSSTVDQAVVVGRRRTPQPVILTVRARDAWQAGVKFFNFESRLYLSTTIPPEYITAPD
jgi:putative RNA 2'-phosphotransferase